MVHFPDLLLRCDPYLGRSFLARLSLGTEPLSGRPRCTFCRLSYYCAYLIFETFTHRRRIFIAGNCRLDLEDSGIEIGRFGDTRYVASDCRDQCYVVRKFNLNEVKSRAGEDRFHLTVFLKVINLMV